MLLKGGLLCLSLTFFLYFSEFCCACKISLTFPGVTTFFLFVPAVFGFVSSRVARFILPRSLPDYKQSCHVKSFTLLQYPGLDTAGYMLQLSARHTLGFARVKSNYV